MGSQEHFLKGQTGIPLVIELSYYINSRQTDILWVSRTPVAPLCVSYYIKIVLVLASKKAPVIILGCCYLVSFLVCFYMNVL